MTKEKLEEATRVYNELDALRDLRDGFQNDLLIIGKMLNGITNDTYEEWKQRNLEFLDNKIEELKMIFESI